MADAIYLRRPTPKDSTGTSAVSFRDIGITAFLGSKHVVRHGIAHLQRGKSGDPRHFSASTAG